MTEADTFATGMKGFKRLLKLLTENPDGTPLFDLHPGALAVLALGVIYLLIRDFFG